jgi:hypothetical protein
MNWVRFVIHGAGSQRLPGTGAASRIRSRFGACMDAFSRRGGCQRVSFEPERAKRPILGKAQMVRVGRGAATDQTRLLDDEPHVFAVAYPPWLGMR